MRLLNRSAGNIGDPLFVEAVGKGQPVVFLHGMVGSTRYWQRVIDALGKTKYRLISFDLLGFGQSPKPSRSKYDYDEHIKKVLVGLDNLGEEAPVILVGHSMGALISLRLAATHPERVKKVVLIGMPIYTDRKEARREITSDSLLSGMTYYGPVAQLICRTLCRIRPLAAPVYRRILHHLPKEIAEDATLHTWESYSRSMENIIEQQDVCQDLRKLKCEAILIYGEDDSMVKLGRAEKLISCNDRIKLNVSAGTHQLPIESPSFVAKYI